MWFKTTIIPCHRNVWFVNRILSIVSPILVIIMFVECDWCVIDPEHGCTAPRDLRAYADRNRFKDKILREKWFLFCDEEKRKQRKKYFLFYHTTEGIIIRRQNMVLKIFNEPFRKRLEGASEWKKKKRNWKLCFRYRTVAPCPN